MRKKRFCEKKTITFFVNYARLIYLPGGALLLYAAYTLHALLYARLADFRRLQNRNVFFCNYLWVLFFFFLRTARGWIRTPLSSRV